MVCLYTTFFNIVYTCKHFWLKFRCQEVIDLNISFCLPSDHDITYMYFCITDEKLFENKILFKPNIKHKLYLQFIKTRSPKGNDRSPENKDF